MEAETAEAGFVRKWGRQPCTLPAQGAPTSRAGLDSTSQKIAITAAASISPVPPPWSLKTDISREHGTSIVSALAL